MTRRVYLETLLEEVHQVMREKGMDSWLEAALLDVVKKAWERIEARPGGSWS